MRLWVGEIVGVSEGVYIRALARINVWVLRKRNDEEREEGGTELGLNAQKLPYLQRCTSHLRQLTNQPLYVGFCKNQPHTTTTLMSFIVRARPSARRSRSRLSCNDLTQSSIPQRST